MNRRTITLTTFVVIVAGLIFAQLAAAMTVPGLSVTLECNRYTYGTFTYIADRDNTGNNKERTYIRVMDGLGTVLFNDQFDTTLGSYPAVGDAKNYTGTPQHNTLYFVWVSVAGNGLPEQMVYSTSATLECVEEPTETPTEEPTVEPTEEPTVEPTEEPTVEPTEEPTVEPTEEPTVEPTEEPTVEPTEEPTVEPTEEPTVEPTEEPTKEPVVYIPYIPDDRIAPDPGVSLNAYCREIGFVIYSDAGQFVVTNEQIAAVGVPATNTLIATFNGVDVLRLNTGEFQIMGVPANGKREIMIFDMGDSCSISRWRRGQFYYDSVTTHIYNQSAGWDGYPFDY